MFHNAEIILGGATRPLLDERVYPANPEGRLTAFPENQDLVFIDFENSASSLPGDTRFERISPFTTFAHAVDFLSDGSLYLVDTPGHIAGHLSALARIAPEVFMFLAGDLCHHREAYEPGIKLISESMYEDLQTARATVRRLVKLNGENSNVIVVLAHEPQRVEEGMPLFPEDVKDWAVEIVKKRRTQSAVGIGHEQKLL